MVNASVHKTVSVKFGVNHKIWSVFFDTQIAIWANYSDLTQPICPQKVAFSKGNGTVFFREI